MSEQQVSHLQEFRSKLEGGMRAEIAKALPHGLDVDRFIRTVITVVQLKEDLLYADRRSLFASCMKAAQDGLLPDGREAVLNIYNTKQKEKRGNREVEVWVPTVQYLPMVRGLIKVMRNSGEVASIDAAAVYDRDLFRFKRGDDPRIEHEPYLGDDDPGPVIASYVIVKLTNGEVHREVMPRRDIEKTREASKSGTGASSPWTKWYDQMSIKAVIKRAAKLLPNSSEALDRAIANDNEASGYVFESREEERVEPSALPDQSDAQATPAAEQQQQASPALVDDRAGQDARRPSRLAGLMRSKVAEQVQQNSNGEAPPWENAA
ncbi:recombinase RecT [Caballeronia sp. SEWSISQ10-4 2]|uniref:recombinase RecT n=1 Tax=Caballeronia sp. SEWSISQ10-4 2 TaxID=2937438 RepID=UPI002651D84F|nr:recombinase RecT [Caballeronia sp. SEWSISQ10-4 2]MDN7179057.1 recombinase RecT [Caballeronia sp. SEWSISQ10-4 2]